MKPEIDDNKVVIFTGAGISVSCGIPCFAGSDGLWGKYNVEEVCTRQGFEKNPSLVTEFYNNLKKQILNSKPSAAHKAIAELERFYDVTVITTNLDNYHEIAGSSNVIHVHGNLQYGKSHFHQDNKIFIGNRTINTNEQLDNIQLRHDVVFYGEYPENLEQAKQEIKKASKILVIGSSLSVSPSNTLLKHARFRAEKAVVNISPMRIPYGFKMYRGNANEQVTSIVDRWIEQKEYKKSPEYRGA
ncbi:SIR2 family NAD-dependent protein deacylase [Photobacterium damselae]|uniref:SIR2 family NAD-dependent protein deacylase n=1 Tax=Photobacterium damselae TaxID=38293 RepID=UPI001F3F6786|nr:Sir2 family NAD-dependent protein deacetylase [Photobacterium damselae]UKA04473.1 hypothetical protein IHC89_22890 [Photobacterium damselae subsp. damselae]